MSTKQSLVFTEGSSVRNLAADRIVGRVQKSKIRAQGRTTPHCLCRLGAVFGPFSPLESVVLGLLLAQAALLLCQVINLSLLPIPRHHQVP